MKRFICIVDADNPGYYILQEIKYEMPGSFLATDEEAAELYVHAILNISPNQVKKSW